jgi:hypothetical protein
LPLSCIDLPPNLTTLEIFGLAETKRFTCILPADSHDSYRQSFYAICTGKQGCFSYDDCRASAKTKVATLDTPEFIRRFAIYIFPKDFKRIRYFGILSSTSKETCAGIIREHIPPIESYPKPAKEI